MRIIGGAWRGRRLEAPEGQGTRPTGDRVRETLFNLLQNRSWGAEGWPRGPLAGARVLDAFAGTGALGLEALSRGAERAIFFDTDRKALESTRRNIAALGAGERGLAIQADSTRPPPPDDGGVSLAFLDPPWSSGLFEPALRALLAAGWFAPGAMVVTETAAGRSDASPEDKSAFEGLTLLLDRAVGASRLRFWKVGPS